VRDLPQVGADGGLGYGRGAGFGFGGGWVTWRDGPEGGGGGGGALCGGGGAGRGGDFGARLRMAPKNPKHLIDPRLIAHCRFPRISEWI